MRQNIEERLLRLVRLYTLNTPVSKGKYRLFQATLAACKTRPGPVPVRLADGRRFYVDLTTGMQESLYFVGEFERVLTEIAVQLIDAGDVCIDAGANFGWYTSLFSLHAGLSGAVHAFEPTPRSFAELKKNYELNGEPNHVFLNDLALGEAAGTVQIHLFDGLTTGHASLAARETVDSTAFDCRMITLDSYLDENRIENVNFLKADVEGGELQLLLGSTRLFDQPVPPIILMEMAAAQTAQFGYHPNDLIEFISEAADYEFFAVNEYNGTARLIERFEDGDIGANVFCIPRNASPDKRAVIEQYLNK